ISSAVAFTPDFTRAANVRNEYDRSHSRGRAGSADVAQHAAQLHVHLDQRLLHALNRTAGLRHQVPSLPPFFTADLRQMARWLVEKGVRSVAMKLPAFGLLNNSGAGFLESL